MSDKRTAVEEKVTFSWERSTRLDAELRRYAEALDEPLARRDAAPPDRTPRQRQ